MMYAINKRTNEHRKVCGIPGVRHGERLVQADDDGWIPWEGGECPLPEGALHEVRLPDGKDVACDEPEHWDWGPEGRPITAYRPILDDKPSEPEAPEWDGEGMPPKGMECEMARVGENYGTGSVQYKGNNLFVWQFSNGVEIALRPGQAKFRLIRSAEDKAVEEMHQIADACPGAEASDVFRALYRAGFRKEPAE